MIPGRSCLNVVRPRRTGPKGRHRHIVAKILQHGTNLLKARLIDPAAGVCETDGAGHVAAASKIDIAEARSELSDSGIGHSHKGSLRGFEHTVHTLSITPVFMEFFIQTKVGPVEFLKIAVLVAPLFHEDLSDPPRICEPGLSSDKRDR